MIDFYDEAGCVLLVDKPLNWTSFDVVNKIRYSGKFKKVGHAGTLDPLATGLLILCVGKKTKSIDSFQAQEKEYTGQMLLGKTTPSVDLETEFNSDFPTDHITDELLFEAKSKLTGMITQTPPAHSAVKINGKRAYESARIGETPKMKEREVMVMEFDIDTQKFPEISFRIKCSKGTYIRSIVRDFGTLLNSGACLTELRRTKIGDFRVENASDVLVLANQINQVRENLS